MKPTQDSPLSLEACSLRRLVVEVPSIAQAVESESLALDPDVDYDMLQAEEGWIFLVMLTLAMRPTDRAIAARIEIELEGVFSLPEGTPEERVWQLVPGNCLAILYGIARGIVAQATGSTRNGAYWLPAMNFSALIREKAAAEAAEREDSGPAREPARKKTSAKKRKAAPRKKKAN